MSGIDKDVFQIYSSSSFEAVLGNLLNSKVDHELPKFARLGCVIIDILWNDRRESTLLNGLSHEEVEPGCRHLLD